MDQQRVHKTVPAVKMLKSFKSSSFCNSFAVCSKEWAVNQLRERASHDKRYNFLLRQSEKQFRCYTLVYMKPMHRDPVCLQIKQVAETGHYQLVVSDSPASVMSSVLELVAHYRRKDPSEAIKLDSCVAPTNPRMSYTITVS